MNKVFWAIVAIDTALFLFALVSTLFQSNHDGGRDMALFFFVLVPAMVLGLAILLFVFSKSIVWRVIALLVLAGPGSLLIGARVRNAYYGYVVSQRMLGRGYFSGRALKDMGAAVVQRDLATLQKSAPGVDVNTIGIQDMTLLRLAVAEAFSAQSENKSLPSELPIVHALLALGAKPNPGLDDATKLKDPTFLQALLEAGGDASFKISSGPVAFDWITIMPGANLRLLLEHGASANAVNDYGSPLAVEAALAENWDAVIVLLEHGVDAQRADNTGRTLATIVPEKMSRYNTGSEKPPAALLRVTELLKSAAHKV